MAGNWMRLCICIGWLLFRLRDKQRWECLVRVEHQQWADQQWKSHTGRNIGLFCVRCMALGILCCCSGPAALLAQFQMIMHFRLFAHGRSPRLRHRLIYSPSSGCCLLGTRTLALVMYIPKTSSDRTHHIYKHEAAINCIRSILFQEDKLYFRCRARAFLFRFRIVRVRSRTGLGHTRTHTNVCSVGIGHSVVQHRTWCSEEYRTGWRT